MKLYCDKYRCYVLLALLWCLPAIYAQDSAVTGFLDDSKGYSSIYRGEIEYFYNPYVYKVQPYYVTSDFSPADLYYNGRVYENVSMRYDTYIGQFLLLTPLNHSIIVNADKIEKVKLHGKDIIKLTPPAESGLKTDFYIHLYNGKNIKIISRERHSKQVLSNTIYTTFEKSTRYYAVYNGRYYGFKNKKSFTKLLPQYKKEINKFAKENRLNFSHSREESLAALGAYCDDLLDNQTR